MKIVVHPDYARLRDFIAALPLVFEDEGETLHEGRNTVKRFRTPAGETVVAKRYKRPNLVQRVAYTFFRPSKAERAYRFAALLRERGFDTPREVAYMERRTGGLLADSYFVSLPCDDPPLSALLRRRDFDRSAADRLAAFLVALHEAGVLHGDLNLSNILYRIDERGTFRFTLIDTNRSRFRPVLARRECTENLKRVTHDKALLRYLVRQYAVLRGWKDDECVREVFRHLLRFERSRRRLRHLRRWTNPVENRKSRHA